MKKISILFIVILALGLLMAENGFALNNCLDFDGTDDYVDVGAGPGVVKSVEFWVKPFNATDYFLDLDGGGHLLWADAGTLTATGFTSPSIYINGVLTTTIAAGRWQHVAVTMDTGIDAADLNMGRSAANYLKGKMDEVRLWDDVRTEAEIRSNMYKELAGTEPGLAAYFKFNQTSGTNLPDRSPNSYDGSLTNYDTQTGYWQTSSAFFGPGNALDFNGTDQYVTIPDNDALDLTASYTVEAWIYVRTFQVLAGIAGKYQNENTHGFTLRLGYSGAYKGISFNDLETPDNILKPNTWHHVVGVKNGDTRKVYVDGIEYPLSGTPYAEKANDDPVTIGCDFLMNPRYMDGLIDEVRLWNIARTATQIRDDMYKTVTGSEAGLVACYRFDQHNAAGQTTLYDITANSNNGTLTNMDPATDWVSSTAFNTWVGSEGTDWAAGGNWSRNAAPVSTDNVGVFSYTGGNSPSAGAAADANHLAIATNATLTLGDRLTLAGNWINNGTADIGSGTVAFQGAEEAFIIGETTFNDLTVDKSVHGVTLRDNSQVDGTLTLTNGQLNNGSATLTLGNGAAIERSGGSLTHAPSFTTSVDLIYSGATGIATGHELPASTTVLNDLTVNNAGGVALNADAVVNHSLALTDGRVTLGGNDLTLGAGAQVTGDPSASNMVVTNGTGVMKKVFSGIGSFTFPVGDDTGTAEYSPATLDFTAGTFNSAHAAVGVTSAKQPRNASNADYLNRYWTVTQNGITGFTCNATFNYLQADVAGDENGIYGGRYKDGAWTVFKAVDAVNDTFSATVSGFSDFTGVEGAAPSTQAGNIGFSNVNRTRMQVSWTRGSGGKVLVLARLGSAVSSNPVNGTGYTGNATFGGGDEIGTGNYVVYSGTGTSLTVTGLTADTAYYFRAYEYNDTINERYATGTVADNPNNKTTLPHAPAAPAATTATGVTETGFTANWNVAAGAAGYRLDVSLKSDFGEFVSGYRDKDVGAATSASVTGLTGGAAYYYRVRAVNAGGTSGNSNTISVTTTASPPIKISLSGPANVVLGAVSTPFTLTSLDADGNPSNVTADTTFDLSSNSSGTKLFYGDAAGTSVITRATITKGSSASTFYYRDSVTGTPNLTAAWNSGGWDLGSDSLQITVSLPTTTLATSTSVDPSFTYFRVRVTKVEMYHQGTSAWKTIFKGGESVLDLVTGGKFPSLSYLPLPVGTYNKIRVTFRNSFDVSGMLRYNGTDYYTTDATFGGETSLASVAVAASGGKAAYNFKIVDWGAILADVTQTDAIAPVTVSDKTFFKPALKFTISDKLKLKGVAGIPETYYFTLSAPTVSIVAP